MSSGSRIERVRLFRVRSPLATPYASAHGTIRHREAVLVELVDSDGCPGWGECGGPAGPSMSAASELLAPLVLGADPREYGVLWQRMWTSVQPWGRRGAVVAAHSGFDLALWDLAARQLGVSASTFFGGCLRRRIPCAAPALAPIDGPESSRIPRLVEEAESLVDRGYRSVAVHLGRNLSHDRALVRALRESLPRASFTAMAQGSYDLPEAQSMGDHLANHGFAVFEEPLSADQPALVARLAAHCRLPIAAGRFLQTRFDYSNLVQAGSPGVLHLDLTWCGGASEAGRIRSLASAAGINVTPVGGTTAIGHAAMVHFLAADTRQPGREETLPPLLRRIDGDEPLRDALPRTPVAFSDGVVEVPSGTGWGIDIDPDFLRKVAVATEEVVA